MTVQSLSALAQPLKIACCQLMGSTNKLKNLENAKKHIIEAASNDAKLIILPECFNAPYAVDKFEEYAEEIPNGETTKFLSSLAKELSIFLVGGSIPELAFDESGNKHIYNTSVTFNPRGEIIGKHRKVHLFDMCIPNGIQFKESDSLTAGNKATVFELEGYGTVGEAICYDIRFPELFSIACRPPNNAFAMIVPAAFNMSTGPLHWHILAQARAIDNECFVIMCSPARDTVSGGYVAYGHSMIIDPMGKILCEAGEGEEIVYAEIDSCVQDMMKAGIPLEQHRRFDVYQDTSVGAKVSDI